MSVIVQDEDENVIIYTKGADSVIHSLSVDQ